MMTQHQPQKFPLWNAWLMIGPRDLAGAWRMEQFVRDGFAKGKDGRTGGRERRRFPSAPSVN